MKAITLTQPWATLVALGAKAVETRSWATYYAGPLAIHAAKTWSPEGRALVTDYARWAPAAVLRDAGYLRADDLPLGAVLAVATLASVREITPALRATLTPLELAAGSYETGRYAWFLTKVRRLPKPIPVRGALGLWEFEGVQR